MRVDKCQPSAIMKSMSKVLSEICKAIRESDKTPYRIAQESGVEKSALSRLLNDQRGLSIEAIERLADCLGLDIVVRPKRKRKGR